MDDLAFFTTDELINELFRRSLFRGVLVRYKGEEGRTREGDEATLEVLHNVGDRDEAISLLGRTVETMSFGQPN